jgi:hypothetical protein
MNKLLVVVFVLTSAGLQAQFRMKETSALHILRAKEKFPSYQSVRCTPFIQNMSTDYAAAALFWQGASYTNYSENGRLRSTHTFDVHGQLRETRASFSLKKRGLLSLWRIQVSSRRNSPLFIYTIPR